MVYVYALNIATLPDPRERPEILFGLWQERKEKALRPEQPLKRRQSAGAALLLKSVLKRHAWDCSELKYGHKGKPLAEGIFFNLSHSEELVICAVADGAVGCDIEKTGAPREKVAERYFAPTELEYIRSFPDGERAKAFFRLWTMKESYLKMSGEGLSVPLNSFCVNIGEAVSVSRESLTCICRIKEYQIEGYCVSVCSEDVDFSEGIEFIPVHAL